MNRLMQAFGVMGLLAWTGLGAFAWFRVEDRVVVTFADGDAGESDELALLGDRVRLLSDDLGALTASLEDHLGRLAEGLHAEVGAQATERLRLERRLAHLEAALPQALAAREAAGALDATLRRLEALLAAGGGEASPRADDAILSSAGVHLAAPQERVDPATPGTEVAGETPDAAPPAAEEPAAAEPARSFLAFRLPSRTFRFEGPQEFRILEDLSRVGFDAKSTLHDFSGVSDRVRGTFRVDLARPAEGIEGRVEVDARTLDTGLEGRDEAMQEHLDVEHHPALAFVPTSFTDARVDAAEQRLEGELRGEMTIRGVTRPLALPVRAHVDESRRLVVEGEAPVDLTDYRVPVPNKLGVISMEDVVRVWIHLRARTAPPEVQR